MPYSRAILEINRPLCDFTVFRFSRATILPPEQEKAVRAGWLVAGAAQAYKL